MIDIMKRKKEYYSDLLRQLKELELVDENEYFAPLCLAKSPNEEGCTVVLSIKEEVAYISFLSLKGKVEQELYQVDLNSVHKLSYNKYKPFSYISFWGDKNYFSFYGYNDSLVNGMINLIPNLLIDNQMKARYLEIKKCYGWSLSEFIIFTLFILGMALLGFLFK